MAKGTSNKPNTTQTGTQKPAETQKPLIDTTTYTERSFTVATTTKKQE